MYSTDEQRRLFDLSKSLLQGRQNDLFSEPPAQKAEDLRLVLQYHEWRYYVQNDPVISDFEYDQLYKQLEQLEGEHPDLITPDSPTRRIGADLMENAIQVNHLMPMLSLDNSYNADDLRDFDESVRKLCKLDASTDIEYCVEPKYDGGTIVLVYENDRLVRAATRGNGYTGDEITANMRTLRTVPLKAAFSGYGIFKTELRGEALIRKDIFEKINAARQASGEQIFANPRNAATGGLRMKDPREAAGRGLEAFVYQLGYATDEQGNNVLDKFRSHDESIHLLESLSFKTPLVKASAAQHLPATISCRNI
ncbi:MAG: DNA ligase LigA-related protein, partial [Bacteroidota bacterium]